jgi:hypothetical protein
MSYRPGWPTWTSIRRRWCSTPSEVTATVGISATDRSLPTSSSTTQPGRSAARVASGRRTDPGLHQCAARARGGAVEHDRPGRRCRGVHADLLPLPGRDRRQRAPAGRCPARFERLADISRSARRRNRRHDPGDPVLQSPQSDRASLRRRRGDGGRRGRRAPRSAGDQRRGLGRAGPSGRRPPTARDQR